MKYEHFCLDTSEYEEMYQSLYECGCIAYGCKTLGNCKSFFMARPKDGCSYEPEQEAVRQEGSKAV
jgi:hypothetical protein